MTLNIRGLGAQDIARGIKHGNFSCVEVVTAYLDRIKANSDLNAFISTCPEQALKKAAEYDDIISRDKAKAMAPLLGVPVAVKDIICTKNLKTTGASKILADYVPPYNATAVSALEEAGAIVIGKTNCDEFAMGSSTETSFFGPTLNPWDKSRVPGGSSGGSAVAVSADLAPVALGTDTGGSVRQPASFCNLVGFKPSYGSISRYGLMAMASSLDQIGIFSHTVEDTKLMFDVMVGPDKHDHSMATLKEQTKKPIKDLVIGLPQEYFNLNFDSEINKSLQQTIEVYKDLGCQFVDVSIPLAEMALAMYYVIMPAEVSSNLARLDGLRYGKHNLSGDTVAEAMENVRSTGFGAEVKRRILLGTYVLSSGYQEAYYGQATKLRQQLTDQYDKVCQQVDLLLTPTAPTCAFKLGEKFNDPLTMYLADIFTVSVNIIKYAGMSLPSGFNDQDLPIGHQLIAPGGREDMMMSLGMAYQQVTDWHIRQSPC